MIGPERPAMRTALICHPAYHSPNMFTAEMSACGAPVWLAWMDL